MTHAPPPNRTRGKLIAALFIACGLVLVGLQLAMPSVSKKVAAAEAERILSGPRFPEFSSSAHEPTVTVTIFFDVECPACGVWIPAYVDAADRVRQATQMAIDIELKHYPLETECNPYWIGSKATLGCEAAVVLESVKENDGEAQMVSVALELMKAVRQDVRQMAQLADVDASWLAANYDRLLEGVRADVAQAAAHGIMGTPTLLINGLRVRTPTVAAFETVLSSEIARMPPEPSVGPIR